MTARPNHTFRGSEREGKGQNPFVLWAYIHHGLDFANHFLMQERSFHERQLIAGRLSQWLTGWGKKTT